MQFKLPDLPYADDALEPHISARTLSFHYGKHHRGYVNKLDKADNRPEGQNLVELIRTSDGGLFNLAAQVWNHTFFWKSMQSGGGGKPSGELASKIDQAFGDYETFKQQFAEAANGEFGSGWAWLVLPPSGKLEVRSSSDAENPIQRGHRPLITLDVWEHSYYLDYQNERDRYVEAYLDNLVNWDFAAKNLGDRDHAENAGETG